MTRRQAIEKMLAQHREGARPLRWVIVKTAAVGWVPVACWEPWLDITPELLDDVEDITGGDAADYLEGCFE